MVTTRERQMQEFERLIEAMQSIRRSKNEDYANEEDSLANFRSTEPYGIPAWVGIFVRLNDKVARLGELVRKFSSQEALTLAVDEKVEDTAVDLANYALLLSMAYQEWEAPRLTNKLADMANQVLGVIHIPESCGICKDAMARTLASTPVAADAPENWRDGLR